MTDLQAFRVVWDQLVPEYEWLYNTSPYFKLSVDQLTEHVVPALMRGTEAPHPIVREATRAMLRGFAEQAVEMDRRHEALMRQMRSVPAVPRELFEDQAPRVSDMVRQRVGDRTVVRHPADC